MIDSQLFHYHYYYYYKKKRFRWRNVKKTARTPYNTKTVTKCECDAKCHVLTHGR